MRRYYWYISTFIRKHGILVLMSVIGAIIFFSFFLPFVLRTLELKKKSYVGVVGRYTLDNLPRSIQEEIGQGLTTIQEDGTPVPALAERWNTEDEGKTYRFVIKRNQVWQDGQPFVPSDINYNFSDVQVITTTNDVIFKLQKPYVPFPTVVSQPVLKKVQQPYLIFFKRTRVIGTGEYDMIDYKQQGERLSELVVSSPEEQKIYRFYLTEEDALSGFKRGEVDILPDLSSPRDITNWPNVEVKSVLKPQRYLGVFFNTKHVFFSTKELRQALNYALEKPTDDTRAVGPISPTSWAFANVGKSYDYDIEQAVERLMSGLTSYTEPISFELTTTKIFEKEAESIKKQWEHLGEQAHQKCVSDSKIKDKKPCDNLRISVKLHISDFPDADFQALLVGEESPSDPDQYIFWHSDEPTNITGYSNVRIDSLLERGRQTEDRNRRFEIYQDFQQFFSEDAPVIFIRHLHSYEVKRKGK